MKKKYILILFILMLSGCTNQGDSTVQDRVIMTTVKPITDITQAIVGDNFKVQSVFPENSDPHHYELTAKTMQSVVDSEMFIYISDENNGFSRDLKESGNYNSIFLNITQDSAFKSAVKPSLYGDVDAVHTHDESEDEHADDEHNETPDENHEEVILNPHIWLSPKKLMLMTDIIVENVSKIDADNAELYRENGDEIIAKLSVLDEQYEEFAKEQKFPLIVTHDSVSYLTSDYGIDTIALYDLSHESEPTAKEIEGYITKINDEKIPAIFVEQNDQTNKLMQQIADYTDCELKVFNNLSTSDQSVDTLTILEENLTALTILK